MASEKENCAHDLFGTNSSPRAKFGRAVLRHILNDRSFFEKEESEEWCALLAKYGYVERVTYDPSTHGDIDHADAGDEVWIFTEAMRADARDEPNDATQATIGISDT